MLDLTDPSVLAGDIADGVTGVARRESGSTRLQSGVVTPTRGDGMVEFNPINELLDTGTTVAVTLLAARKVTSLARLLSRFLVIKRQSTSSVLTPSNCAIWRSYLLASAASLWASYADQDITRISGIAETNTSPCN